jgi:hypothetical protein
MVVKSTSLPKGNKGAKKIVPPPSRDGKKAAKKYATRDMRPGSKGSYETR